MNPDTGYSVEGGEDIILGKKRQGLRDSTCMRSLERSPVGRGGGGGELLFGGDRVLVSHDEKILGVVAQEHEQTQHC